MNASASFSQAYPYLLRVLCRRHSVIIIVTKRTYARSLRDCTTEKWIVKHSTKPSYDYACGIECLMMTIAHFNFACFFVQIIRATFLIFFSLWPFLPLFERQSPGRTHFPRRMHPELCANKKVNGWEIARACGMKWKQSLKNGCAHWNGKENEDGEYFAREKSYLRSRTMHRRLSAIV